MGVGGDPYPALQRYAPKAFAAYLEAIDTDPPDAVLDGLARFGHVLMLTVGTRAKVAPHEQDGPEDYIRRLHHSGVIGAEQSSAFRTLVMNPRMYAEGLDEDFVFAISSHEAAETLADWFEDQFR
jgi:hypothetical protein